MLGKKSVLCVAVCWVSLTACGGNTDSSKGSTGGTGGSNVGGAGGNVGGAGGNVGGAGGNVGGAGGNVGGAGGNVGGAGGNVGGAGGNVGGGGMPTGGAAGAGGCTPHTNPGDGAPPPSCADVDGLAVSNLTASDAGGDGTFSPGESGSVAVKLTQITGYDFYSYPSVTFTADDPGVTFGSNGQVSLFGIGGCQTSDINDDISFASSVVSGTTVHITASAGALNLSCPNASSVTLVLTVK